MMLADDAQLTKLTPPNALYMPNSIKHYCMPYFNTHARDRTLNPQKTRTRRTHYGYLVRYDRKKAS